MVSQLKRLKASLQSAGVTGPKPSSKKRKRSSGNERRVDKNAALQSIREEFNPFETKTTRTKHDIINARHVKGKTGKPSLSKSVGEEARRKTLLVEMQNRNKVGGIVDRRFGENDPTMAPEEKMLERFTRETKKKAKGKADLFNLEDDDGDDPFGAGLTHFGQSLGQAQVSGPRRIRLGGDEEEDEELLVKAAKTQEDEESSDLSEREEEPTRKKTKKEVMKEVIAKSKLHKYERQKRKEEDEDERERLDAQMGDLWALLGAKPTSTTAKSGNATGANNEPLPDRQELKEQNEKPLNAETKVDETYDRAVREMMFDKRSKPSDRTKTEEERVAEESERLKELEEARQRRMNGMDDSEEEEDDRNNLEEDDAYRGDAEQYGLGQGIPSAFPDNPDALVDGDYEVSEDGYVDVDEDGRVDGEISDDFDSEYSGVAGSGDEADTDSEDDEFLADIMPSVTQPSAAAETVTSAENDHKLAYTFPCPQTHKEMLEITKGIPTEDLPTVVQRIRILHHPKLHPDNHGKLATFSTVLLDHIVYVADLTAPKTPFRVVDTLIRHLHALSKSYPESVAASFRDHLITMHKKRTSNSALLTPGDLTLLTAIATIFPTSDNFHQIVTPAQTLICKWLAQTPPSSLQHLVMGTYLVTLVLVYQRLSKRYVPEAINYILQGLCILSPTPMAKLPGNFPYHPPAEDSFRLHSSKKAWQPRKLAFADIFDPKKDTDTPLAALYTLVQLVPQFYELWASKCAIYEVFSPALVVMSHLSSSRLPQSITALVNSTSTELSSRLARAKLMRRPLELHHHRPLPIPSNEPKFEEGFNPDTKSYDPDPIRREQAKLKAELKKERKGAMRELRKDSAFVARERLTKEKEESKAYWEKMRKVEAQVQTEEGAGKNAYEREKKARAKK